MRPLKLSVSEISVTLDDPALASRVEPALREALKMLGEKLATSPFARDPDALDLAVSQLSLDPISSSALFGSGGPARLSEQLYRQLTQNLRFSEAHR